MNKKPKLKLTKLELEMETKNGTTVELSLDEARELYEQLHELFGKEMTVFPTRTRSLVSS